MATTYEAIASVTVGSGGAADIEFTSIPGTYTDLVLSVSIRSSQSEDWAYATFNGSTANFSARYIQGNGTTAFSSTLTNHLVLVNSSSSTASTFSSSQVYIPNYAGNTNKSISVDSVQENNATTASAHMHAQLWSNTAAITSIKMTLGSGNFVQYSTATLFGIKNS